jgi:hypothetical protein
MYTHSPDPSKQYAILRKIRGSRDEKSAHHSTRM